MSVNQFLYVGGIQYNMKFWSEHRIDPKGKDYQVWFGQLEGMKEPVQDYLPHEVIRQLKTHAKEAVPRAVPA